MFNLTCDCCTSSFESESPRTEVCPECKAKSPSGSVCECCQGSGCLDCPDHTDDASECGCDVAYTCYECQERYAAEDQARELLITRMAEDYREYYRLRAQAK